MTGPELGRKVAHRELYHHINIPFYSLVFFTFFAIFVAPRFEWALDTVPIASVG